MTREEAMAVFRTLVAQHGLRWTARSVPDQAAWDQMAEAQRHLTEDDRRAALGWPRRRSYERYSD